VDGGGTSTTVFAISTINGGVGDKGVGEYLGVGHSGSTNRNSVGEETAVKHLLQAIHNVLQDVNHNRKTKHTLFKDIGVKDVSGYCLSMSGVNQESDGAFLVDAIQSLYRHHDGSSDSHPPLIPSIQVFNDSRGALASGTLGELHGIVVISGTGMIVYGRNATTTQEATGGGHGALIDDGSGYMIGLNVIRAVLTADDGMTPSTSLIQHTLQHLNMKNTTELVPWLYSKGTVWASVASLAPLAFTCAHQNDAVALSIVKSAANYLIRAVQTVANKLQFDPTKPLPIVLNGGIIEVELMSNLVSDGLKAILPNAEITRPKVDPAHGAALLALYCSRSA